MKRFLTAALLALATTTWAGTVTCTNIREHVLGAFYIVTTKVTMSGSYATGGDTFGTVDLGTAQGKCLCNSKQRNPEVVFVEASKGGYLIDYDHTNFKMVARVPISVAAHSSSTVGIDENAGLTGLEAHSGAAFQVATAEVGNTVSLSSITVRTVAYCQ
jgi:hypothetical protein